MDDNKPHSLFANDLADVMRKHNVDMLVGVYTFANNDAMGTFKLISSLDSKLKMIADFIDSKFDEFSREATGLTFDETIREVNLPKSEQN